MSERSTLSAGARAWGATIALLGVALGAYIAVAFGASALSGSPIVGAVAANCAAFVLAMIYRWRSRGTLVPPGPQPRALRASFWGTAVLALTVCWLAGQTAAFWVKSTWGSANFEAVSDAQAESPLLLLLAASLVFAPLGEEALMRGIAYPAVRRHWPPLASAFVTASVFALLHGNVVQIALTLPLGVLLAFVYEASQRLWPSMLMHVGFNMAAAFTPASVVAGLAHLPMIVALLAAVLALLFALTPGRYAIRERDVAAG